MSFNLLNKEHSRDRDLELRKKKSLVWYMNKGQQKLWYNIQQDTKYSVFQYFKIQIHVQIILP